VLLSRSGFEQVLLAAARQLGIQVGEHADDLLDVVG
jgi:hypothetical protein